MKIKLFFFCLFCVGLITAQNWRTVGQRGFSDVSTANLDLVVAPDGNLYAAFYNGYDSQNNHQLVGVYRSNSEGSWNQVGANFIGRIEENCTVINSSGVPIVVVTESHNANTLKVKQYTGGSWQDVGNLQAKGQGKTLVIDSSDNLYLAYNDNDNDNKLAIQKFDGSTWQVVGGIGVSDKNVTEFDIDFDNNQNPYVIYNTSTEYVTVKKFNGTSWETLGNSGFIIGPRNLNLEIFDDKVYVGSWKGVFKLENNVWNSILDYSDFSGLIERFTIDGQGYPHTLEWDHYSERNFLFTRRYVNNKWIRTGSQNLEKLGAYYLTASSKSLYVIFPDGGNYQGKASVFKYDLVPEFNSDSFSYVTSNHTGIAHDVNANNGFDNTADYFVRYFLSGDDANLFEIDLQSGEITFKNPPDFKNPLDADTDNIYEIKVTAASTFSGADMGNTQDVQIYVIRDKNNLGNKWQQIGNTIYGNDENDYLGLASSISANGKVIALGKHLNSENGFWSGKVAVYTINNNTWELMGGQSSFTDATIKDIFGSSLDLSADGKTLIVGAPGDNTAGNYVKVFQYDGSSWVQKGNTLTGELNTKYGQSVSISDDGNIIAIGAPDSNENGLQKGKMIFFRYDEYTSKWQQFGLDINNNVGGTFLELSADGETLITSHRYNPGGTLALYRLIDNRWKFIRYFNGLIDYKNFSISENGNVIAYINDSNPRSIKVLKYNSAESSSDAWSQIGSDIEDKGTVSISKDGKILTVGDFSNYGKITSYFFNGTDWKQIGNKIIGKAIDDSFGSSLQLSADGQTVVVSAPNNNTNANNAGQVKVFNLVAAPIFESSDDLIVYQEKGTTPVIDVNANDGANGGTDSVAYQLEGADASFFNRTTSGVITFKSPPEWKNPQDANTDNIYEITIKAINTNTISKTQDLQIYVFPEAKEGNKWQQVGNTVEGDLDYEFMGYSVVISDDGLTALVGSPKQSVSSPGTPKVQVFRYSGTNWIKLGNSISVSSYSPTTTYSTDISADGNTIIIGVPAFDTGTSFYHGAAVVYKFNGTDWEQLGNVITRIEDGDQTGHAVSISKDGKIIVVSSKEWRDRGNANADFGGAVRVFKLENNVWIQLGETFKSVRQSQQLGKNISLTADGKRIAIASGGWVGTQVYEWQNNAWVQLGTTLGDLTSQGNENPTRNIKLNARGDILALGHYTTTPETTDYVYTVRVFEYVNNEWKQKGSLLERHRDDYVGHDLDLSADGTILALGAPSANLPSSPRSDGKIKVYKFLNNDWHQIGEVLRGGDNSRDRFGYSVNLNADGSRLIVGAPGMDNNPPMKGYFKVFDLVSGKPIVNTIEASNIEDFQVTLGGNVLSNGGDFTTSEYGVVYALTSENDNPEIDGTNTIKKAIGSGLGEFSENIENLKINSDYSFKAYAMNSEGITYGEVKTFKTTNTLSIVDKKLENSIKIYPNPVENQLKIKLENSLILEKVEVYNLVGKMLLTTKKKKLNTNMFSSGFYLIKFYTNEGLITKRIIKK